MSRFRHVARARGDVAAGPAGTRHRPNGPWPDGAYRGLVAAAVPDDPLAAGATSRDPGAPAELSGFPAADSRAGELGRALRLGRLRQGLSLRAVTKRVGLAAHSAIVAYETGQRIPHEDILPRYEEVLRLPPGYLMNLRKQALCERAERTVRRAADGQSQAPGRPPGTGSAAPAGAGRAGAKLARTPMALLQVVRSRAAAWPPGRRRRPE